jgi:hypothetical protein
MIVVLNAVTHQEEGQGHTAIFDLDAWGIVAGPSILGLPTTVINYVS